MAASSEQQRPSEPSPTEPSLSKEIDLTGQVALITGSSRGIGKAIALRLARHGATVAINSTERSEAQARETVKAIEGFGQQALWIPGDVSEESTGQKLVQQTIEHFGKVDVLVHNAGTREDTLAIRMKPSQWHHVIATNLDSSFFVTKAVIQAMVRKRTPGSLVFISSIAAHGNPGQANYTASKAGIEALMKTIAKEYGGRNIRANAIACGLVETDLTADLTPQQKEAIIAQSALQRPITPDDIASVALFLTSPLSKAITGQVINVDGGTIM